MRRNSLASREASRLQEVYGIGASEASEIVEAFAEQATADDWLDLPGER